MVPKTMMSMPINCQRSYAYQCSSTACGAPSYCIVTIEILWFVDMLSYYFVPVISESDSAEYADNIMCSYKQCKIVHDDVIKWKHFPRYWPFVRGIHRSPVNSPYKGQWRGALMFTLICAQINGWVNNGEAGDLRRNRGHYDVIVMNKENIKGVTALLAVCGGFHSQSEKFFHVMIALYLCIKQRCSCIRCMQCRFRNVPVLSCNFYNKTFKLHLCAWISLHRWAFVRALRALRFVSNVSLMDPVEWNNQHVQSLWKGYRS